MRERMSSLGLTLKDLRVELSKQQVLVTLPRLRKWLEGEHVPNAETARGIAEALDCPMETLFKEKVA